MTTPWTGAPGRTQRATIHVKIDHLQRRLRADRLRLRVAVRRVAASKAALFSGGHFVLIADQKRRHVLRGEQGRCAIGRKLNGGRRN